jgi:putative hydrolase of the HAD superfamily
MKKIKAVILDLGVVIINIDQEKTLRAFERLGIDLEDINESMPIFKQYEKGEISDEDFIRTLKTALKGSATENQIIKAWNAMILDIPTHRFRLIGELRKHYNVHLLSNTNSIHIKEIRDYINTYHQDEDWQNTFDKMFLSYEIGLRKPEPGFYEHVLNEINLKADETIFIDDSRANIKGAEKLGINCIWTQKGIDEWLWEELKKIDPNLYLG